jgi:hypothetical protein
MMPDLDRGSRESLDRARVVADLDVLADPERVIEQINHAGEDVSHQSRRAEADGTYDEIRAKYFDYDIYGEAASVAQPLGETSGQ